MRKVFAWYFRTPLVLRIFIGFLAGSIIGILLWSSAGSGGYEEPPTWKPYVEPFGAVFVNMLKMIVIPVIFFSLIVGAASLPIKRFGRIGLKVIGWYLLCSLLAAGVGVFLALTINPGSGRALKGWETMAADIEKAEAEELETKAATEGTFRQLLLSMFENPFGALSSGNFLPIIVFSILFGLAVRVILEASKNDQQIAHLESLMGIFSAVRDGMFKLVDWILEYSPVGVLALSIMNFGLYGPQIVGPYISVTLGVIGGILLMIIVVYSLLLWIVTKKNPFHVLRSIQEAMVMAFMTRSSAATLPVSLKVAKEELKVRGELASFSLPLGATINMDGVCVHLPMFAVLAANMFGFQLTPLGLALLVITTVLASIGAGGVPGGSLMLLFIILETMGLNAQQVAVIVALALGINPILDMFETMNNITGDLVCTYVVADREKLLNTSE
jgi:proton glutamate symport protein